MIRQPSSYAQLHAWWSEAVKNPDTPRHDGIPECGFYRMQMVKGGPYVPVRVFVERTINEHGELEGPERLVADVAGDRRDPRGLWLRLNPISRADYDALRDRARVLPAMAATMVAVDLTATPMRP